MRVTDHGEVDPVVPGRRVEEVDSTPEDSLVAVLDVGDLEGGAVVRVRGPQQEVAPLALGVGVGPVQGRVTQGVVPSVQAGQHRDVSEYCRYRSQDLPIVILIIFIVQIF